MLPISSWGLKRVFSPLNCLWGLQKNAEKQRPWLLIVVALKHLAVLAECHMLLVRSQLHVFPAKQHILKLHIPVNDAKWMHVAHTSTAQLCFLSASVHSTKTLQQSDVSQSTSVHVECQIAVQYHAPIKQKDSRMDAVYESTTIQLIKTYITHCIFDSYIKWAVVENWSFECIYCIHCQAVPYCPSSFQYPVSIFKKKSFEKKKTEPRYLKKMCLKNLNLKKKKKKKKKNFHTSPPSLRGVVVPHVWWPVRTVPAQGSGRPLEAAAFTAVHVGKQ